MTDMYAYPVRVDSIAQGDIFFDCLIHLSQARTGNAQVFDEVFSLQQVIVLTQSCDLAQAKISHVVVAPILPAEEYVRQGLLKPAQIRDQVRTGRMFGLY